MDWYDLFVTQLWLYMLRQSGFHIKSIDSWIYADSFSSFTCPATTTLCLYQNRDSMCGDNVTSILLMDEFQNSTEYLVEVEALLEVPGTYSGDKQNMASLLSILCYFHTLRQSYKSRVHQKACFDL